MSSVTFTLLSVELPVFVTTIVNITLSPGNAIVTSANLDITNPGTASTVTCAWADTVGVWSDPAVTTLVKTVPAGVSWGTVNCSVKTFVSPDRKVGKLSTMPKNSSSSMTLVKVTAEV